MTQLAEQLKAWEIANHAGPPPNPTGVIVSSDESIGRRLVERVRHIACSVGEVLLRAWEPRPAPGYEERYDPVTFTREWRPRKDMWGRVIT